MDVAEMIKFLISDKARFITGAEFIVDGGFTCC
ncbi:SDR family oxidoreductase [[Eubacterium] hominis]